MALMPGATIRLIPRHNTGAKRPKGRGTSFHVTASSAASMFGYFSTVGDCSHFHVAKDGTIEQYIDTDYFGAAQVEGNDMVSVETQGAAAGVNAETEPWTPQQVASNARIARWVHDTEGAPLVLMPDSKPASRGVASHRLGILPWRVAGGQVWSRVNGKVCPGSAKIAQLPQVIALAVGVAATAPITEDDMPFTEADLRRIIADEVAKVSETQGYAGAADWGTEQRPDGSWPIGAKAKSIVATEVAKVLSTEGVSGAGDVGRIAAAIAAAQPEQLAAAIPADIAQQVADLLAERLAG